MNIMWFSAGVSSFIAAYLVKDELDKIIYMHIDDQHPDSLRFLHDCKKVLGKEIEILQNKFYANVETVCRQYKFISSPHGAKCTGKLKKDVRKQWEYENGFNHIYFWGLDSSCREVSRAESIEKAMPNQIHRFPLIERDLTKEDAHGICRKLGVKRPAMYDLGYHNNNCIGCVKGGKGYWNKIRNDFPEVFAKRAKLERDIGHSCINGTFLDSLNPDAGRDEEPISEECGIMCEVNI